jgi:hypothetical protein
MRRIVEQVLPAAYALLPRELRTPEAARLILAVGAHASGFHVRRLAYASPKRGYWLLGVDQVAEVLRFSKGRGPLVNAARELGYGILTMERGVLQAALEHNDCLGFVVARCLLPPAVEALQGSGEAWAMYRELWRPSAAAADGSRWAAHYDAAGAVLATDERMAACRD